MWSNSYHSQCPKCQSKIHEALQQKIAFCMQCRFPLMLLAGKYQLNRLLGEGGAGKAYLAHHIGFSEASERVIKVLNDKDMNQAQIQRFQREVQLTARLSIKNEHIVRLYDDFGYEPNLGYFFVMEYLQGRLLSEELEVRGTVSIHQALDWFCQLCHAMEDAHRSGIIHRDLKPENIMLISRPNSASFLKVLDFGIAKLTQHGSQTTGHAAGTPLYMSPEQLLQQPLDHRSDIYTMGFLLYIMLTGHVPYGVPHDDDPNSNISTIVYAKIHNQARSICKHYPELKVPHALDQIILQALRKNPGERFPSLAALWHQICSLEGPEFDGLVNTLNAGQPASLQQPIQYLDTPPQAKPEAEASPRVEAEAYSNAAPTLVSMPSFDINPGPTLREQGKATARSTLPTLRSWSDLPVLPVNPGNLSTLKVPANRFLGRQDEWDNIDSMWSEHVPVVTLLGPTGIGKTRLAQEYGLEQREKQAWPGGVWYCDLSHATSIWHILETLTAALQTNLPPHSTLQAAVTAMGRIVQSHGPSLWIFDRFDHLTRLAFDTLGTWIPIAPEARFLITSRRRLKLKEERMIELSSLPLGEAIELFVERASDWVAQSQITSQPETLQRVVQQLDGHPLSVELASTWLKLMSLHDLEQRLSQANDFLQGSDPGRPSSKALRNAIDWSWQNLSAEEQSVLAQCTIFQGGFTLDAAEKIVRLAEWPSGPSISQIVTSLREQSMLRSVQGADTILRYDMYDIIRNYAAPHLEEVDPDRNSVKRHTMYYLEWADTNAPILSRLNSPLRLDELRMESENLRSIRERCLSTEAESALHAHLLLFPLSKQQGGTENYLQDLQQILSSHRVLSSQIRLQALQVQAQCLQKLGQVDKARETLENALAMVISRNKTQIKAQLLGRLGSFYSQQSQFSQAETMLQEALTLYREQKDVLGVSQTLGKLGNLCRVQGRMAESEHFHTEALALSRQQRDLQGESIALCQLGNLYRKQGKLNEAISHYHEALDMQSALGDLHGESITLGNLSQTLFKQGEAQLAQQAAQRALYLHRSQENRRGESITLNFLGLLLQCTGQYAEASTLHSQALVLNRQLQDLRGEGFCLLHLARILRTQGEWDESLQFVQHAISMFHSIPAPEGVGVGMHQIGLLALEQREYSKARNSLQQALSHLRYYQMYEEEGEILLALSLLHHLQGDLPTALNYTQEALALSMKWENSVLEFHCLAFLLALSADLEKFELSQGARHTLQQKLREHNNPTLSLVANLATAHLDWKSSQHAQWQDKRELSQEFQEKALQKWNEAASLLQHSFSESLNSNLNETSNEITCTDLLRLHLTRLQKSLYG